MPPVQTTYDRNIRHAVVGLVANMETANSITRHVEDEAGIGFGVAVYQGTADREVTATPGTLFRGITIRDVTLEVENSDVYPQNHPAGVLVMGVIWVEAGGTVAAGDPVGVVTADNTFVTFDPDDGDMTGIPGAVFDSSGTEGDLVRIRLTGHVPMPAPTPEQDPGGD